jgi:hypothetical protein
MRYKPSEAKKILDLLVGTEDTPDNTTSRKRKHLDAIALLSLPEHLRKTALAIHEKGRATATMISEVTGRPPEIERSNLNELEEMGYLDTEKKGAQIFFSI